MKSVLSLFALLLAVALLAMLGVSLSDDGDAARRDLLGLPSLGPSGTGGEARADGSDSSASPAAASGPHSSSDATASPTAAAVAPAQADPIDPAPSASDTQHLAAPSPPDPATAGALSPRTEPMQSPWSKTPAGTRVALLETLAPDAEAFILRGTIPVPAGTWFSASESVEQPFAVLDFDGSEVPTQLEVVSRFADPAKGADVVEVMARVRRDPKIEPGARIRYGVVVSKGEVPGLDRREPNSFARKLLANTRFPTPSLLVGLFAQGSAIRLTGADASGVPFSILPLEMPSMEILRDGPVAREVKSYGVMLPGQAQAPSLELNPLPHLFGVHAYARVFAGEPVLLLDLRINNGGSGLDPESSPLGEVYFENLTLEVPSGYAIFQAALDPGTRGDGTASFDLVAPVAASMAASPEELESQPGRTALHFMPTQAQFHRRLAIAPTGSAKAARRALAQVGLAFPVPGEPGEASELEVAPLLSWFNSSQPSYGPQAQELPRLEHIGLDQVRAGLAADFNSLRGNLTSGKGRGSYPLESDRLGWAHPYGVAYGGMTGGAEIHLLEGVAVAASASNAGYLHLQDLHRMQTDRMPVALYNTSGRPSAFGDWQRAAAGERAAHVPFSYFGGTMPGRDKRGKVEPFGYAKAPSHQVDFVRKHNLQPAYEASLAAFQPHDSQHLIRYTTGAKALAWLGNDSLAKDDLLQVAENFHLEYHHLANGSGGDYQGTGLMAAMKEVEARPGVGFTIGRGQGWGLDAAAAAYSLSRDEEWRHGARTNWLNYVVDTVAAGQSSCSGIIQSKATGRWLGGRYRVRQSIEQCILENSLEGLLVRVFADVEPARERRLGDILAASYRSMISDLAWAPGNAAPWSHLAVGSADGGRVFCTVDDLPEDGHDRYTDGFQIGQALARGFQRTGDERFLEKARIYAGGESLRTGLEAAGTKNLANLAALLALAQGLEPIR